jgi:hypothetical protein
VRFAGLWNFFCKWGEGWSFSLRPNQVTRRSSFWSWFLVVIFRFSSSFLGSHQVLLPDIIYHQTIGSRVQFPSLESYLTSSSLLWPPRLHCIIKHIYFKFTYFTSLDGIHSSESSGDIHTAAVSGRVLNPGLKRDWCGRRFLSTSACSGYAWIAWRAAADEEVWSRREDVTQNLCFNFIFGLTFFKSSLDFLHSNPTSRGSVDMREIGWSFMKDTFYVLCVSTCF